jgi:hypothetical protein
MASSREPLSVTHPELAAQADGWDASTVTSGSDKQMKWSCNLGHTWTSVVSSRVAGKGCPICAGKTVLPGFNDLKTLFPELATEALDWDPTKIRPGSHQKLKWKCKSGHVWEAEVKSRSRIGAGCPYCDGRNAIPGVNDLATLHPLVAAQAHGWNPKVVNPHSHKKLEFICGKGHVVLQGVRRRVEATGCPVCQNDRVLIGYNDLATTHPELAAQADGWDPSTVTAGTHKKLKWKCPKEHTWTTEIVNRAKDGTGCPSCSGRIAISGETDLATTHPEIAAEAVDWDPTKVKAGTSKKLKWQCELGHQWITTPASRAGGQTKCPICSGLKVLRGFNDLATSHPDIAAQAVGWDPTVVSSGNDVKRLWRCERNHEWEAQPYSRASLKTGCPYCVGRRSIEGETDLATTHPDIAAQAVGWDPKKVGFGSGKRVQWECANGHQYISRISHRTNMMSGCPTCAQTGFDPNQEGWLYLIENVELNMFQIGISNFPEQRLRKHSKGGWEVIEVRGPMEGHLVQQLETAILHAVERRGAVLGHKAEIEKFDGYSEAWTKDSLPVDSFKQLLDWVYEDDEKLSLRII